MSVAQVRNAIKVEGVVTVCKYGESEYRWTRTPHAGAISTRSSEIFTDEWSAWLTAMSVAPAFGCMLRAPDEIRQHLIAHQKSQRQGEVHRA